MCSLDRQLVEHYLLIKAGKKPVKQLPRCIMNKIMLKVKDEVEKLLPAKLTEPTRHAEWIAK